MIVAARKKVSKTAPTRAFRPDHYEILNGLPFQSLLEFERTSGHDPAFISEFLGRPLPGRTRRKRLTSGESDRLSRLSRITDAAVELFEGNRGVAVAWLNEPARAFEGETPLQRARTELGAREVEDLIGRIEHGVFS